MPDTPPLKTGDPQRLGSYELIGRLGQGGQGVVYLGRGPEGLDVAIKVLRADLAEDETARSRFLREATAAKTVARFCTAQVLEADVDGDSPYIVSEYVPGPSLQRLVKDAGPREGADLERLAIGTVTALAAIHQAGIVHRDFKPHNVLMAPDGPRVIDFGIARAFDTGVTAAATAAIGTPAYMAPEQVMSRGLTPAVDVFSWASTMVYAATGGPPFGQDDIPAVINRILNEEPELGAMPSPLRELVAESLAKEPEARPTAQELLMRLLGQPIPATPSGTPGQQGGRKGDTVPVAVLAEGVHQAGVPATADPAGASGLAAAGTDPAPVLPPVPGHGAGDRFTASDRRALLAVVAVLVALCLAGVGAWALTRDRKAPVQRPVPTVTVTDSSGPESSAPARPPASSNDGGSDEPTRSHAPVTTSQAPPTSKPPTSAPPTSKPPTSAPPTSEPPITTAPAPSAGIQAP